MSQLVLASKSKIRADLLRGAGLDFECKPVNMDEDSIKDAMVADHAPPRDIADTLAALKAERAKANPDDYVIGADQVLVYKGKLFSKPSNLQEASDQLKILRGQKHELISAVCIAQQGRVIWRTLETAKLTMRDFTDDFLKSYLDQTQDSVCSSVGCYQLEGPGLQLFEKVEGDYFTILGLPLLPILDFLRLHKVIQT